MLDTAYLGHVIVLWSWALKQPNPDAIESTTVRFRSLDGRDREIPVPRLTFHRTPMRHPAPETSYVTLQKDEADIDFFPGRPPGPASF